MFELRSARFLAADVMQQVIRPGDHVIDATMGNGHDTQFLAELVGPDGLVDAFDIQPDAVRSTEARLRDAGLLARCRLHCAGHEHLAELVDTPVRAVMFNLGWLPGGDKQVTTLWPTTETAIRAALGLLQPGGTLTVCAYPGHAEGAKERDRLAEMFASLRPQEFNALHQRFLNAGDGAPECFVIQKQGGETV